MADVKGVAVMKRARAAVQSLAASIVPNRFEV
jgi:hypothetical protein